VKIRNVKLNIHAKYIKIRLYLTGNVYNQLRQTTGTKDFQYEISNLVE